MVVSSEGLTRRLRERSGVFVSPRDIERILSALLTTRNVWQIIRLSRTPMKVVCSALWLFIQEGIVDRELELSEKGRELSRQLGVEGAEEYVCRACQGRGVDIGLLAEVVCEFSEVVKERPKPLRDFDQGYVTVQSSLGRVSLLLEKGDLVGKGVVVLGDDDLVSVALGLTGKARRVTVVDVDRRLIEYISVVSRERGLNVEAVVYDLREPIPVGLVGGFDVFLTDPTESLRGLKVFLERGLLCLKGAGCSGYFGLTYVESSLQKWYRIQSFLLDKGCVITDIIEGFNHYVNWGYEEEMGGWEWLPKKEKPRSTWYTSSLYRIEMLTEPRVRNLKVEGDIFRDEESATV